MEVVGGIKAEYLSVKNENAEEDEAKNVVEIRAEDIQGQIKREPEDNEEATNDEIKKVFNLSSQEAQQQSKLTEYKEKGKNETEPIKSKEIHETLILNDIEDHFNLSKRGHRKKVINNNSGRTKKRIKASSKHRAPPHDSKLVDKNEFTHLKNKGFCCNHCQAIVTSRKNIFKHIRHYHRDVIIYKHTKKQLKYLAHCATSKYTAWYEYIVEGDDRHYRCQHCRELFEGQDQVEKHIVLKHRILKYKQCPHCSYQTEYDLTKHMLFKHTDDKDIEYVRCDQCNYKSKHKSGLRQHIQSVHRGMMVRCPHCPKLLTNKQTSRLRNHIKVVHMGESPEIFKCFHCPYNCTTKASLMNHLERCHTKTEDLPTLQCKHCSYRTIYTTTLYKHVNKKHVNNKTLQCHICSYQCSELANLKLHMIGHKVKKNEEELKYRCDKCDYKTYRLYSFQVHKLNHVKPEDIQYFYCYHCDFKAKRKDNLKTHIFRHFKQDEKCHMCDFTTKKRQELVRHMASHSKETKKRLKSKVALTVDEPSEETSFDKSSNEMDFGKPSEQTDFDKASKELGFDRPSRKTDSGKDVKKTGVDKLSREPINFSTPSKESGSNKVLNETDCNKPLKEKCFEKSSKETRGSRYPKRKRTQM